MDTDQNQYSRRDFVKTGTLGFSFMAGSGWALSFDPADVQGGEFNNFIPFPKTPRNIREVGPGFLLADVYLLAALAGAPGASLLVKASGHL